MDVKWETFPQRHARLLPAVVVLKTLRTKAGFVVFAACVANGLYHHHRPVAPDQLNAWALVGLALVVLGVGVRLAAHGCLHKKEQLSTTGIYSLCRHPLYLGSIVWTFGFCFLLNDWVNFVIGGAYFAIFYSVTIIWEEVRVRQRYGEAHDAYAREVPMLLPLGRFKHGLFAWSKAMRAGGALLIAQTAVMLVAIALVAVLAPPGWWR
jgi:protein-S-isoprenylcysteine O-methyltransferase Ste14